MKKGVALVAVLAAVSLAWWWFGRSNGESPIRGETREATATRGELRLSVSATGDITPIRQVELKSKASGLVTSFPKLEGGIVEAGELICSLDKTTSQRDLEREQANLKTAEARLTLTRLEYTKALAQAQSEADAADADLATKVAERNRLEQLEGGVVTETDLANARLAARLAEEKLKQAKASLALVMDRHSADLKLAEADELRARAGVLDAEERLRDTDVRSPIRGILLQKLVEEGQIVSSGISATSGGTAIAMVADVSSLVVVAKVDETDIGRVKSGGPATVTVESLPGRRFEGRVELIPPRGEVDSSIIVFKVRIGLDGRHFGPLKIGMTATVSLLVDEAKDALLLPSEAVKVDKGRRYVLVPGATGPREVDVKTGLDDGTNVQILEGLKEGETVVIVYSARPAGTTPGRMRRW